MKHLAILLITLFVGINLCYAQWDLDEDFNNGIPDDWLNEVDQWSWIESGPLFPTSYLASGAENMGLYTPWIDISEAEHVVFQTRYLADTLEGWYLIEYSFWQEPWVEAVRHTQNYCIYRGTDTFVLTEDDLAGHDLVRFVIFWEIGPDGGMELYIDHVRISTQFPGWVDVDLDLQNTNVPSSGGDLQYTITLTNTLPFDLENLSYATFIHGQGPVVQGPFITRRLTLPANSLITRTLQQFVPAAIPDGARHLYTYVGYPSQPAYRVMDLAQFWKEDWNTVEDSVDKGTSSNVENRELSTER